jgi:peptide methionine sulfoxide reductase MsrB
MIAAALATQLFALPRGVIHGRRGVIQGAVAGVSLFRMSTEAQAAPELPKVGGLIQRGTEELMAQKGHGTTANKVQANLRWGCDGETADRICSFNRHYAEYGGYWKTTNFLKEVDRTVQTVYYDSVSGKPLFVAPVGRSFEEFARESDSHGWPSFRDQEVVWENMRILPDGESVSVDGTHLGHNIPDRAGNRYCINLVSVAGRPLDPKVEL